MAPDVMVQIFKSVCLRGESLRRVCCQWQRRQRQQHRAPTATIDYYYFCTRLRPCSRLCTRRVSSPVIIDHNSSSVCLRARDCKSIAGVFAFASKIKTSCRRLAHGHAHTRELPRPPNRSFVCAAHTDAVRCGACVAHFWAAANRPQLFAVEMCLMYL